MRDFDAESQAEPRSGGPVHRRSAGRGPSRPLDGPPRPQVHQQVLRADSPSHRRHRPGESHQQEHPSGRGHRIHAAAVGQALSWVQPVVAPEIEDERVPPLETELFQPRHVAPAESRSAPPPYLRGASPRASPPARSRRRSPSSRAGPCTALPPLPEPRSSARPTGSASGPSIMAVSSAGTPASHGANPSRYMSRYTRLTQPFST